MMMNNFKPVMFLDIDGVLATNKEYSMSTQKFWAKNEEAKELRIPYPFNQKCVKILNDITTKTDAQIVITSIWKNHWTINEMAVIFKFNKIISSPVEFTPSFNICHNCLEKNRGYEIDQFIKKNRIASFVVVDDINLEPYVLEGHFVKTRDVDGLKQCNVKQKILKILERQ